MERGCDRAHRVRPRAARPRLRLLRGRRARLGHRNTHLLLLDARRLAGEMTEVIQLRAANAPTPNDQNLREHRAVHRENALDANPVRDLPHRERLAHATTATRDANALERLNALLLPFLYPHVDAQRVAGAEWRNVAEPLFLGFDEGMHMTLRAEPGKTVLARTRKLTSRVAER